MTITVVTQSNFQASAVVTGAGMALSGGIGVVCNSPIYDPQQAPPPSSPIFTDNAPKPTYPL